MVHKYRPTYRGRKMVESELREVSVQWSEIVRHLVGGECERHRLVHNTHLRLDAMQADWF